MKKTAIAIAMVAACAATAHAQQNPRDAYRQQQAFQEVQRLAAQFDQMQNSQDSISARLARLEGGAGAAGAGLDDLRNEIAALRAQIDQIKREQGAMEKRIVAQLAQRIASLPAARTPPPAPAPAPAPAPQASRGGKPNRGTTPPPPPPAPEFSGDFYDHEVAPGQTLALIAREYGTTVNKILSANPGLKPERLRPGKHIKVPAEK